MSLRLSVVIPCFNESPNLPVLLDRCKGLASLPGNEVILVDNGSTDDTHMVLRELLPNYPGCRAVRVERNRGYGYGICEGLRAARGEILAWTHADMQTDPLDIIKGLNLFDCHGNDIFVKGRRLGRPLADEAFSVGMSIFETLLLRAPMWDINAQPTMFSRSFFECWESPPDDFSLDLYAYYQAQIRGLKVHRFPVIFADRAHGVSHWNVNWASKQKFIRRTIDFSLQLRKKIST